MGADAAEEMSRRLQPQSPRATPPAASVGTEDAGIYLPDGEMPEDLEPADA